MERATVAYGQAPVRFLAVVLLLVVLASVVAAPARADEERAVAAIDYATPRRYAKLAPSAGEPDVIRRRAEPLEHRDGEQTLRHIHAHIASAVPHVPERGWLPHAQDFEGLVGGFDHADCARHALVFCNLARACGIPAVYVKSMRHEWIRTYAATGKTGRYAGHVFLEVHLKGRWRLLDAQGMRIWDDYDPQDPELPGALRAYEKGWDHRAMVHSTQRERFKAETKRRWKDFDPSALAPNAAPGRKLLPPVYAATVGYEWKVLHERIPDLAQSFDRHAWGEWSPKARGAILLVTSIAGKVAVPPGDAGAWLPLDAKEIRARTARGKAFAATRRLGDGTLVVLLAAPGWSDLMQLLWSMDFPRLRAGFARPR